MIKKSTRVIVAFAVIAAPWCGDAQEGTVARGQEVFAQWCSACHAPGPRHPGTQALDVLYKGAKPAALEQRTDLTPELTRAFVRTGVSVMPPFRKTEINDSDLEALARYLAPKASQ